MNIMLHFSGDLEREYLKDRCREVISEAKERVTSENDYRVYSLLEEIKRAFWGSRIIGEKTNAGVKVEYNCVYPTADNTAGPYLTLFYEFWDNEDANTACFFYNTTEEAIKAYKSIFEAIKRKDIPVDMKRVCERVYVRKRVNE